MFDHSSQANTGTRCCIFKTIYDNSTSTSYCRRFKRFGRRRSIVASYTYISLLRAEHTQEPIVAYLDIEIETECH